MTANQAEFSIQLMSRTLGVARSGFHAHHSRPPSARQVADDALTDRIATIHEASKHTYGVPRIHAELAEEGINVSYAGIWVTRPDQAARFAVSFAATPSLNVTPSMSKGN